MVRRLRLVRHAWLQLLLAPAAAQPCCSMGFVQLPSAHAALVALRGSIRPSESPDLYCELNSVPQAACAELASAVLSVRLRHGDSKALVPIRAENRRVWEVIVASNSRAQPAAIGHGWIASPMAASLDCIVRARTESVTIGQ